MTPRSPNGPILVGYDGRPQSDDALALAKAFARTTESWLLLVWVEPVGPLDLPYEDLLGPIQDRAEDALREVARDLRDDGFEVGTRVGLLGSAAQGIHEFAETASAELVVVGSCHRGTIGRVLAGTVGTRLLHGSPCPVAIAPRGFADGRAPVIARIGVGYDGSEESQLALAWAERLARATTARLRLVVVSEDHSTDLVDIGREKRRRAERVLAEGLDRTAEVPAAGVVKSGLAIEQLERESANVDLMVIGSRGYGPLRRVLLGSVSSHLVRHSKCPVVVTPRATADRHHVVSVAGTVLA